MRVPRQLDGRHAAVAEFMKRRQRGGEVEPTATELEATATGVALTVTAESVLRDLCVFADRLDPDAVVDQALVTLVPGERTVFTITSEKLRDDPELAARLGAAAHARVLEEFLGDRHLGQYVDLFSQVVAESRLD